jgi:hypothetical protein
VFDHFATFSTFPAFGQWLVHLSTLEKVSPPYSRGVGRGWHARSGPCRRVPSWPLRLSSLGTIQVKAAKNLWRREVNQPCDSIGFKSAGYRFSTQPLAVARHWAGNASNRDLERYLPYRFR